MTRGLISLFSSLSLLLFLVGCSSSENPPSDNSAKNAATADPQHSPLSAPPPPLVNASSATDSTGTNKIPEPEATVINLLISIFKADKNAVQNLTVPKADAEILCWKGKAPDDFIQKAELHPEGFLPGLRRVQPGEAMTIFDKKIDVKDSDVNQDRVFIEAPKLHMGFVLVRLNGVWKVDPSLMTNIMKSNLIGKGAAKNLDEPEQALVNFMFALVKGDKEGIENSIAPNPDWAILAEGEHIPENQVQAAEAELRLVPYKRLKPGDVVNIGKDKTHIIDASEINENRMLISDPEAPMPFILVRINGEWKVDAGPIIAGRKAAAAAKGAH